MMIKDKVMTFDYSAAPSLCSENLVCLYAQLPTISRNCGCFRDCKSMYCTNSSNTRRESEPTFGLYMKLLYDAACCHMIHVNCRYTDTAPEL